MTGPVPPASSRGRILSRVRVAVGVAASAFAGAGSAAAERERLADAGYAALPRDYLAAHHDPAGCDLVALFAERTADYRAVVQRVPASGLAAAVAQVLGERAAAFREVSPGSVRFLVPAGLPAEWLAGCAPGPDPADRDGAAGGEFTLITDDPPVDTATLDAAAGVLTGCAVAIAETGTIILDHGAAQGRRALTLVPDFHLVIVPPDRVAADLPDAFARLDPARPHTLISGPSATSDIELVRVEGVHGPRNLHVLIPDQGPDPGQASG